MAKDNAYYPERHMIIEEIISEWTLSIELQKNIKILETSGRISKSLQVTYFWKF